jgi:hypothetical protein
MISTGATPHCHDHRGPLTTEDQGDYVSRVGARLLINMIIDPVHALASLNPRALECEIEGFGLLQVGPRRPP